MNIVRAITSFGSGTSRFKQICTPQERWKKHLNIVKGNPDHVSIVVQISQSSKIKFKKPYILFGLEKNCSINELRHNIRKMLQLGDKDSFVFQCNGVVPNQNQKIKSFQRFTEADGFIYFYIRDLQAFGAWGIQ